MPPASATAATLRGEPPSRLAGGRCSCGLSGCACAPTESSGGLVEDLNRGPATEDVDVSFLRADTEQNLLYFSGFDPAHGHELWRTDGTPAGTRTLRSLVPGLPGLASLPVPVGGFAFFWSLDDLWRTDGTAAGTMHVKSFREVVPNRPFPYWTHEKVWNGELYAIAGNGELVKSDGTPEGTRRLAVAGPEHPLVYDEMVSTGSQAFFRSGVFHAGELWRTDGTEGGTPRRGTRLPPGLLGRRWTARPRALGDRRHPGGHEAAHGKSGRELWWTNGIGGRPPGTYRIKDLRPGSAGSEPHDLTAYRGAVYFVASAQGAGEALWRSDGTPKGTVRVHDFAQLGSPSWARELTVSNGVLFFVVYNEVIGPELWASRGATDSTGPVVDLRSGPRGSYPKRLTDASGVLVFAATDGTSGLELWKSEGTVYDTVRLGDINPGLDASSPGPFTRVGDSLYFGAYEPEHGRELWTMPVPLP